ncbi:transposase [Streptomyces sp. NPDC051771]|uniref:transposase n=1 Tax=Streptomyces sp. NPDC051771 TaxID=3154847 RepID=UPI003446A3C1
MGTAGYSEEFKRDAVALMESLGRCIPSVAREPGVNPESLRQWVARSRPEAASGAGGEGALSPAERDELRRLRKQSASWNSNAGSVHGRRVDVPVSGVQRGLGRGGGPLGR